MSRRLIHVIATWLILERTLEYSTDQHIILSTSFIMTYGHRDEEYQERQTTPNVFL